LVAHVPAGASRSRPHHPDRRGAASQQLPALAGGVRGDARVRNPVARLRCRRPQGSSGGLRVAGSSIRGATRRREGRERGRMTTNNSLLARGWKPSPLMVRILTAFVFLGVVIGLVLAGI